MWAPTHVHVTVVRAGNLLLKGKNGMNDAFVTIALGKERYQTSVKEKTTNSVQWNEECELTIPKQGNSAEIILTALNRNFIGDDFLGMVRIPLSDFDVSQYQSTFTKSYPVKNKPGKDNSKKRGELEVKIDFVIKAGSNVGSLSDLSKKESHRSSFGQFVGGSLLSLGKEKKGLKKLAKAVGNKVSTLPGRGKKKAKDDGFGTIHEQFGNTESKQNRHEADPGVISDEEDEFRFDELSHKSSHSSLSVSHGAMSTPRDGSLENLGGGEFLRKAYTTPPPKKPSRQPTSSAPEEIKPPLGNETNPIDDWESKLFGRQQNNKVPAVLSSSPAGIESRNTFSTPPVQREFNFEPDSPKLDKIKPNQQSVKTDFGKLVEQPKEIIPKPKQVQEILKLETKFKSTSYEDLSKDEKIKSKEKPKSTTKEAIASFFHSPKTSKKGSDETIHQKGTPIGITSPIQSKTQSETRLPRETLRKFDGKSRDDLIEIISSLQSTVDNQKQRITDMQEYLENLLVRVMENKPTLLQSPYVTSHQIKLNKWDF